MHKINTLLPYLKKTIYCIGSPTMNSDYMRFAVIIFIFKEGMIEKRRIVHAIVLFMLARADGFPVALHPQHSRGLFIGCSRKICRNSVRLFHL